MSLVQHLDKMSVFATIAEAGSLHAASRRLHVSQPALSQTIKTLEKSAGCQLFIRSREGAELTASGRIFYEASLRILKEARALEKELQSHLAASKSSFRVGIFESIAIYAWPKVQVHLKTLLKKHDSLPVEFDLFTGRTEELLKRLGAADIDVAVVVDPEISPMQVRELMYEDSFFLYCSPDDPGRNMVETKHKGSVHTSRPLFLFETARVSESKNLRSSYTANDLQFETINRVDSFEVASEFVRAGLGFALLPERVAAKNAKGLHRLMIGGKKQAPIATHAIYAVAPQSIGLSLPFKLLCQSLRSV